MKFINLLLNGQRQIDKYFYYQKGKKTCQQHGVFCKCVSTLKQSLALHIQASYSADVILPGSSSKLRLLVINLASLLGWQLVNSPAAQSLDRLYAIWEIRETGINDTNNSNYCLFYYNSRLDIFVKQSVEKQSRWKKKKKS